MAELFQIVARTQGKDITEEQVEALSYIERCQMLTVSPCENHAKSAKSESGVVNGFCSYSEVLVTHVCGHIPWPNGFGSPINGF